MDEVGWLAIVQHRVNRGQSCRKAATGSIFARMCESNGVEKKGVGYEWHLLKLLGVAIFPDFLSGNRTGFDEERIGFWASLDDPGLKASGPIAHLPLRDQD